LELIIFLLGTPRFRQVSDGIDGAKKSYITAPSLFNCSDF